MPGGRPTKPLALIQGHRTKAELEVRAEGEKKLLTGIKLKEWKDVKADPIAHKEFLRLKRVLKAINKDDALHESVINRYCLLHAECKNLEELKERCNEDIKEILEAYDSREIDFLVYLEKKETIQERFLALDKKIMEKRKMMLAIEKENVMTIQSALRSIPKEPKKQTQSKMAAFLEKRDTGNGTG